MFATILCTGIPRVSTDRVDQNLKTCRDIRWAVHCCACPIPVEKEGQASFLLVGSRSSFVLHSFP